MSPEDAQHGKIGGQIGDGVENCRMTLGPTDSKAPMDVMLLKVIAAHYHY
jgi:hypothetical protein